MNRGEERAGCLFGNREKEQTDIFFSPLSGAAGKKQTDKAFSARMASGTAGMKKGRPAGAFPET